MVNYIKLKQFKEVEKFLEKEDFFKADIGKYLKIEKKGYDDLVIEKIGEDEYSIAYYYRHPSGDSLREPEITFLVKNYEDKKTFIPLSYTLDSMGIYNEISFELGENNNKPTVKSFSGNLKTLEAVFYNLKLFNNILKNILEEEVKVTRKD